MIAVQVNADKNFAFLEFRSVDEASKVWSEGCVGGGRLWHGLISGHSMSVVDPLSSLSVGW